MKMNNVRDDIAKRAVLSVILAACLVVAVLLGALDSTVILPPVVPIDADPAAFSGARAMGHLESIAVKPHPWYSEENERIFGYILSHGNSLVEKYGSDVIETDIQKDTNVTHWDGDFGSTKDPVWHEKVEGSVINVAFLIKGKTTGVEGAAIQVSSHYDGVSAGPAATDAGAGCAVMMELASVLAARSASGEKLERDVLILFVDAEEVGMLGAEYWSNWESRHDANFSPWSKFPSFAINLEGSGAATSGEMLIRSNSRFATDAYRRYAPHPKALSLTEWLYKTIAIGYTDSDMYWTQGVHAMDLVWVEDRWAYHSEADDVEKVKSGALQHCGENILSIVVGSSASDDFPERMSVEELEEAGVIASGGDVGMDSGTVYFGLMGGTVVWMPVVSARILYVVLAIVMALLMPLLDDRRDTNDAADESSRTNGKCNAEYAKASARHASVALLNLLLGMVASIVAFAAFGMWKAPTEEQASMQREGPAVTAWGGISAARTFLSLFTVFGTAFLVYAPVRMGLCCPMRQNDRTNGGESASVEPAEQVEVKVWDDDDNERNPSSQNEADSDIIDEQKQHFEQLGRDARAGIFYFYDALLLVLGAALPDAACLVLWQPVCMCFASMLDVPIRRWVANRQESDEGRPVLSVQFLRWLSSSFMSAFPALMLLPAGYYILVNVFGYFMDDLGYWYGAPLVESFCFGLVLPLFTPIWLPLPRVAFLVLSATCGLAWALTAISCMAI